MGGGCSATRANDPSSCTLLHDLCPSRLLAGGKRSAQDDQLTTSSTSSAPKKAKVQAVYPFPDVMKPTDESPLPWELALYAILFILQSDAASGKKRRADGGERSAADELAGMLLSESVQRWLGRWVGWEGWAGAVGSSPRASLGSSTARRGRSVGAGGSSPPTVPSVCVYSQIFLTLFRCVVGPAAACAVRRSSAPGVPARAARATAPGARGPRRAQTHIQTQKITKRPIL